MNNSKLLLKANNKTEKMQNYVIKGYGGVDV
jgi:hypothetical protein